MNGLEVKPFKTVGLSKQKLEASQRTCHMCKSGKVENENHFLIEYLVYRDLMQTFLVSDLNYKECVYSLRY